MRLATELGGLHVNDAGPTAHRAILRVCLLLTPAEIDEDLVCFSAEGAGDPQRGSVSAC
jgi:hypothetical protein